MKIVIQVGAVVRVFEGDYDLLHNNEWNEIMQDMIDTEYDALASRYE